jgi:ribosomal-protein-alanine N-acetyltransferase
MTTIEPMAEEHIDAVLAIENVSNGAPWSEESFRREIKNPQAHYFVAIDGEVLGFAGYWTLIDEAHVTTIAVQPEARGKGIGRALMQRIFDDAAAHGMTCATLEVRSSNVAAIHLYESLGFLNSGLRKNYYPDNREDAVIMWRYGL